MYSRLPRKGRQLRLKSGERAEQKQRVKSKARSPTALRVGGHLWRGQPWSLCLPPAVLSTSNEAASPQQCFIPLKIHVLAFFSLQLPSQAATVK